MKAVLFDLDGTLLNTLPDIGAAVNRALARLQLPGHTLEEYRLMIGNGARKLSERAVGPDHAEMAETLFQEYAAEYAAHSREETHVYPGITELLTKLKENGYRLAVLSNKDDSDVTSVIAHYFAPGTFELTRGRLPGVPLKPDPASALQLASEMKVTPDEVWYIGDTAVDIETARNAGMRLICVTWGYRTKKELADAHPERTADTPQEVLNIILNEN